MASVSMRVQVNHARTGWRRGIRFRKRPKASVEPKPNYRASVSAVGPTRTSASHLITALVLRRFQLGEFLLRAIHIVLSCDSQFKKLLLTP